MRILICRSPRLCTLLALVVLMVLFCCFFYFPPPPPFLPPLAVSTVAGFIIRVGVFYVFYLSANTPLSTPHTHQMTKSSKHLVPLRPRPFPRSFSTVAGFIYYVGVFRLFFLGGGHQTRR